MGICQALILFYFIKLVAFGPTLPPGSLARSLFLFLFFRDELPRSGMSCLDMLGLLLQRWPASTRFPHIHITSRAS